jgi:F-type H+-transporting ATPase subunit a
LHVEEGKILAAESGKIDPMHQFLIEPLFGTGGWQLAGYNIAFTNSALWMLIVLASLWLVMLGGMQRQLVPGRWQAMVEGVTGFIDNMLATNVGPEGKKFVPYVFSLFMFILLANLWGMMPVGVLGGHPFTVTSHLTVTGVLAILSFAIVLIVGFARHGLHFFALFVPHGTPALMIPLMFLIELFSFMIRPFSLGLRLFVAMTAGHILMKVLAGFVINGANAGAGIAMIVSVPSFILMIGISALELLVCVIQAYVFALLTSLYLNDAVNLH